MSSISYTVDASCATHPLLAVGTALPRSGHISMSVRRLFCYGTLTLQDKNHIKRKQFKDVLPLWQFLEGLYGDYVQDEIGGLSTMATSEQLTKLSELVGVACGAKVLCEAFNVNPNRLIRYQGSGSARLDFEFYKDGHRYFHEMKGSTYGTKLNQLVQAISKQKLSAPVGVRASSGTITIYEQASRRMYGTFVHLLDPPTEGAPALANRNQELGAVLVYYRNVLSVTHSGNAMPWLAKVIQSMRLGHEPPTRPPNDLYMAGRVREPTVDAPTGYSGTVFDRRVYAESVARFENFDAATDVIRRPLFFFGVSDMVVAAIADCRWNDVLSFHDPNAFEEIGQQDRDVRLVLSSGVVTRDLIEPDLIAEFELAARSDFASIKLRL